MMPKEVVIPAKLMAPDCELSNSLVAYAHRALGNKQELGDILDKIHPSNRSMVSALLGVSMNKMIDRYYGITFAFPVACMSKDGKSRIVTVPHEASDLFAKYLKSFLKKGFAASIHSNLIPVNTWENLGLVAKYNFVDDYLSWMRAVMDNKVTDIPELTTPGPLGKNTQVAVMYGLVLTPSLDGLERAFYCTSQKHLEVFANGFNSLMNNRKSRVMCTCAPMLRTWTKVVDECRNLETVLFLKDKQSEFNAALTKYTIVNFECRLVESRSIMIINLRDVNNITRLHLKLPIYPVNGEFEHYRTFIQEYMQKSIPCVFTGDWYTTKT